MANSVSSFISDASKAHAEELHIRQEINNVREQMELRVDGDGSDGDADDPLQSLLVPPKLSDVRETEREQNVDDSVSVGREK